jgi:hypothetical protein
MSARLHVVCTGEHLVQIAERSGCTPQRIWHHPHNAQLRSLRGDGDILAPGDVLYLPESEPVARPLRHQAHNQYTAHLATITVRVRFVEGVVPVANEPCEIQCAGVVSQGCTDHDGELRVEVPARLHELRVRFTRNNHEYILAPGQLDPVETTTGLHARLENLGYCVGARFDTRYLADALRDFQHDHGLPVTGESDAATRAALVRQHDGGDA